jgi:glutamate/tyrosine decarboxylase-like PLP-dependent enzyme
MQGVTLRVYATGEAHSCHQKAIEILGLGHKAMRLVPSDAALRARPDALDAMIREDIAAGHQPMAVIASAGTVNTGAIDPLDGIADICARYGVWLHVDGAYGAPAVLTERYAESLRAMGRADSLAVDPHKWLSVPVENGLVLVRDAPLMRDTFSLVPPYLRTDDDPWLSEYGIQQTRGFRALKTWMALRYHGMDGYAQRIENDCVLAGKLADKVRARPELELWEPTSLSIVCFRRRETDERNRAVLREMQMGGKAFLSSTILDGRFWLRACFVNHLTTESDLDIVMRAV